MQECRRFRGNKRRDLFCNVKKKTLLFVASVNLNYIKTDTQMKITINLNEMEHILAESNTDETQQKKVDYIQPKIKSWAYRSGISLAL